jgi:hypothetical protein
MIVQTEARIAQIEGRPPPLPPHDELAEIMALRAEQDALARASKAAKAARDATEAALPPAESKAGLCTHANHLHYRHRSGRFFSERLLAGDGIRAAAVAVDCQPDLVAHSLHLPV